MGKVQHYLVVKDGKKRRNEKYKDDLPVAKKRCPP